MNGNDNLKKDRNEELWNADLIEVIIKEIKAEYPLTKVIKGKILKDIFLYKDEKLGYKLQFGFVDQDIVIYDETMDIAGLSKRIIIHNNNKENNNNVIIPKIICELKYNGITSHGLITYSNYASDIKSIFPECKYMLILRYKKNSTDNKLFRHGKNIDKILYFSDNSSNDIYKSGLFISELENDENLKKRFNEFIEEIKNSLKPKKTCFVK